MIERHPQTGKINLKGLTRLELETLFEQWGEPKYRARQLMSWIYQKGVTSFEAMTNLPKTLRQKLAAQADISGAQVLARTVSDTDVAVKYLFELADGSRVESVLMAEGERVTVCVSSQMGCAMACDFCATGKMGFFRNLTAAEILEQLLAIEREVGEKKMAVTNVVFMGMGEPLANYEHTLGAIRLMRAPEGFMLSERRITVSTSGLVPRMRQFSREGLKSKLALSLNATTDEVRTRLMPINAKYPIDEVLDVAREWAFATGMPVTLEYVLIRDVNDSIEDAKRLCKLMGRLPCKLNLIPFNEIEDSEFRRPEPERIEQFRRIVADGHRIAPIRFSKGRDIAAACGQLRTVYEKQGVMIS
ncbi:23S rRNA (adenine(2503)-C(2))-methyltransferase RlmN [Candidatus Poribacteria bacterium]|nr:23S rRNA (adenine(2503)-C(2))-methyltransferase RlmN [Candidatus Poribacteria bacterium]